MAKDKRTPDLSPRDTLTLPEQDNKSADRIPRESREEGQRPSDAWTPASILPTPKDVPGFVHHWVRTSIFDKPDFKNVSRKFREGWIACKMEDYPEMHVMSDIDSRFKGNIEQGGLLLCKAPTEWVAKRRRYFENLAQGQIQAVDEGFMRENDSRMPLLAPERHTRKQFGRD